MTRPIKFRAWDENKKQMISGGSITAWLQAFLEQGRSRSGGVRQTIHKDLHFLQFTGLLDKNGKEIYEGDVVKYPEGYKRIVEWHEAYWQFRTIGGKAYTDIRIPGDERIFKYEIIGNIYENPSLLSA